MVESYHPSVDDIADAVHIYVTADAETAEVQADWMISLPWN